MKTSSETPESYQYAGLLRRLKAFAYDYLVICGYIILLAVATMAASKICRFLGLSLRWPVNPALADLMAFTTLVLPVSLYFTLQESSPQQSTWGKRRTGLRVVNARGGTLTIQQAFIRSIVKFLPWQIAHTCLFHIPGWPRQAVTALPPALITGFALVYLLVEIYSTTLLFSQKRRAPYDWASGSYVILDE